MAHRGFASDNNAGTHPEILQAILAANEGHTLGYGDDPYTHRAIETFKRHFGEDADVYFVFNGTAANVLGLRAVTESYHAVICTATAHIHVDECGAPERLAGVKLLTCETPDGKLTVTHVQQHMHGFGDEHHIQPKVISVTQSTELGTLYTVEEIRALADYAHAHDMMLHMDGARICNAAVALGLPLRAFTRDAGVDVLSFGGTKNGLLGGEAVVLFPPRARNDAFKFIRKQGMQLASKMRFIGAQFEALLCGDLWQRNAANANAMAHRLAERVRDVVEIAYPVQANAVFAVLPKRHIPALRARSFFYEWASADDERAVVRWMCSWDTTAEDVDDFAAAVREVVGRR
ncbi:MAG: threonine aldolase [Anaerolineae bacterium]|nr:threonine aldolase [Anaerolineae bacterium]